MDERPQQTARCAGCGYERTGLDDAAPCPECASTRIADDRGLDAALWLPRRRRAVIQGCRLLFWGGLAACTPAYAAAAMLIFDWFGQPLFGFGPPPAFVAAFGVLLVSGCVAMAVGGFRLTVPPLGQRLRNSAKCIRVCPFVVIGAIGITMLMSRYPGGVLFLLLVPAAFLTFASAVMLYMNALLFRDGDKRGLAEVMDGMAATIPIVAIFGAVLLGIGPYLASFLWLASVYAVGRHIRRRAASV
ncbi:MAG: hypothetical protein AAGB51_10065 [Planctomycetota bacterium]